MNTQHIVADLGETYPAHRQKGADGAKRDLRWHDTADILREIEGFYGHVQGREVLSRPFGRGDLVSMVGAVSERYGTQVVGKTPDCVTSAGGHFIVSGRANMGVNCIRDRRSRIT